MIARSFRPVGWVAAVGAAALGCYMLSLRVASERADLDRLNHRIVAASQNIRSLQTELGTRGRMQQLEAWNEEVLALSAPVSGQFVEGSVSLARFDTRQPPSAVEAPVQLASAAVSAPAPAPATTPAPRPAVATPRQAVAAPATAQPLVRQASAVIPPVTTAPATTAAAATTARRPAATEAAPIRTASREAAPARAATPPVKRPAATPPARSRPAALLDDRTIRALGSASRSERGGGTRD